MNCRQLSKATEVISLNLAPNYRLSRSNSPLMSTNTLKAFQQTLLSREACSSRWVSFCDFHRVLARDKNPAHLKTLVIMPFSLNFFLCCLPQTGVWLTSANITIQGIYFKRKYLEAIEMWILWTSVFNPESNFIEEI